MAQKQIVRGMKLQRRPQNASITLPNPPSPAQNSFWHLIKQFLFAREKKVNRRDACKKELNNLFVYFFSFQTLGISQTIFFPATKAINREFVQC